MEGALNLRILPHESSLQPAQVSASQVALGVSAELALNANSSQACCDLLHEFK